MWLMRKVLQRKIENALIERDQLDAQMGALAGRLALMQAHRATLTHNINAAQALLASEVVRVCR